MAWASFQSVSLSGPGILSGCRASLVPDLLIQRRQVSSKLKAYRTRFQDHGSKNACLLTAYSILLGSILGYTTLHGATSESWLADAGQRRRVVYGRW